MCFFFLLFNLWIFACRVFGYYLYFCRQLSQSTLRIKSNLVNSLTLTGVCTGSGFVVRSVSLASLFFWTLQGATFCGCSGCCCLFSHGVGASRRVGNVGGAGFAGLESFLAATGRGWLQFFEGGLGVCGWLSVVTRTISLGTVFCFGNAGATGTKIGVCRFSINFATLSMSCWIGVSYSLTAYAILGQMQVSNWNQLRRMC